MLAYRRIRLFILLSIIILCCSSCSRRRHRGNFVIRTAAAAAASTADFTQQYHHQHGPVFEAKQNMYADDLDGDGVDEWIVVEGASIFIASSDYLTIGKSYTRAPFPSLNASIVSIVSAAFLGQSQPRVLCALAPFTTSTSATTTMKTNISCGILHTQRYEIEWIVRNQVMMFGLVNRSSSTIPSESGRVDVMVGDFDGDTRDDLLTYAPVEGTFSSYALRPVNGNTFEFALQYASLSFTDGVKSSSYPLTRTNQSVFVGNFFDCACSTSSTSSSSSSNPLSRCNGNRRKVESTLLVPQEVVPIDPLLPDSPPSILNRPSRMYQLDTTFPSNTVVTSDLIFLDRTNGRLQAFGTCLDTSSSLRLPNFQRLFHSSEGFVHSTETIRIGRIMGHRMNQEDLLLYDTSQGKMRMYQIQWSSTSGGRLERIQVNLGDVGRLFEKLTSSPDSSSSSSSSSFVELSFMRLSKSRILQPSNDDIIPTSAFIDEEDDDKNYNTNEVSSSSDNGTIVLSHPSPESISAIRSDLVLFNPVQQLIHAFVVTFTTNIPKMRMGTATSTSSSSSSTSSSVSLINFPTSYSILSQSSSSQQFSSWFGQSTFVFSYAQSPLQLDLDQDGDGILTRYELGGHDPNYTGVSWEPLHTYGCSPFKKDVLVEVDWMADEFKSMKPFEGFDQPAKADLKDHDIILHVFLDQPMPRIENLGGDAFSWNTHFAPLKKRYFTPSRYGLFHYCIFIDRFNGGSVSGQSESVPGSNFFISLGGWTGGHGTLQQQQGTFLHELGHNLNLLHGGNDDQNWKPNHISVMNYAYQVSGIQKDGEKKLVLSDLSCDSLNENRLNEFIGVRCRKGRSSYGHTYQTLIDGNWVDINKQVDFNQDGAIQDGVVYDLNGDTLTVLTGSPNEFTRMRFTGLDPIVTTSSTTSASTSTSRKFASLNAELDHTPSGEVASTIHTRQLLTIPSLQAELSFEEFQTLSNATPNLITATTTPSTQPPTRM